MTTFNDEFAASAFPELLEQFGEETTYRKADGSTREITAIISTNPPALLPNTGDVAAPSAIVRVLNASTGIASNEILLGADKIDVTFPEQSSALALTIQQIVNDDGGVTSVACY